MEGIKDKEIIYLQPDRLGYKDRGMMKWLGMMLSDHSEALQTLKKEEKMDDPEQKEKQSIETVSKRLLAAYQQKNPVIIQAEIIKQNTGNYYQDIIAQVIGHHENEVYFKLKGNRFIHTELQYIRNVEFYDILKWNGKEK